MNINLEKKAEINSKSFLDRGQHDSFVYAQLSGAQLSDDFISLLEKREYSQVFLLDH